MNTFLRILYSSTVHYSLVLSIMFTVLYIRYTRGEWSASKMIYIKTLPVPHTVWACENGFTKVFDLTEMFVKNNLFRSRWHGRLIFLYCTVHLKKKKNNGTKKFYTIFLYCKVLNVKSVFVNRLFQILKGRKSRDAVPLMYCRCRYHILLLFIACLLQSSDKFITRNIPRMQFSSLQIKLSSSYI